MSAGGDGAREEDGASPAVRGGVAAAVLLVAVALAVVLFAGDGGYRVTAEFVDAGQLVEGNEVRVAGTTVGTVEEIEVADERHGGGDVHGRRRLRAAAAGHAGDSSSRPRCPASPTATSTSSSARTTARDIEDGGRIDADHTATAVELDEVFALFDEETRGSLRDFIKGQADTLRGRGAGAAPRASTTSTRRSRPAAGCSRS